VATGTTVNIPTAYPDYNVVEHERIARDDRIAREKEAAAQLAAAEAMAATGGALPIFVAGRFS